MIRRIFIDIRCGAQHHHNVLLITISLRASNVDDVSEMMHGCLLKSWTNIDFFSFSKELQYRRIHENRFSFLVHC